MLEKKFTSTKHHLQQILQNKFQYEVVVVYRLLVLTSCGKKQDELSITWNSSSRHHCMMPVLMCDERFWYFRVMRKSFFARTNNFDDFGLLEMWITFHPRREHFPGHELRPTDALLLKCLFSTKAIVKKIIIFSSLNVQITKFCLTIGRTDSLYQLQALLPLFWLLSSDFWQLWSRRLFRYYELLFTEYINFSAWG